MNSSRQKSRFQKDHVDIYPFNRYKPAAYCHNFYLSLFFSALCGFGAIGQTSMMVTIVQGETDALFRGRVISFIAMHYSAVVTADQWNEQNAS